MSIRCFFNFIKKTI